MKNSAVSTAIKAEFHNALLVVYRGTDFLGPCMINNFVDRKFVGQTRGQSFFVAAVVPGSHYIIGEGDNYACAKINFEAGKVYYLLQAIYPGALCANSGFVASTPEDFTEDRDSLTFFTIDTAKMPPVMIDSIFNQSIARYEQEVKKDSDRHKDTRNIKGY